MLAPYVIANRIEQARFDCRHAPPKESLRFDFRVLNFVQCLTRKSIELRSVILCSVLMQSNAPFRVAISSWAMQDTASSQRTLRPVRIHKRRGDS